MKLTARKRSKGAQGNINQLRQEGKIPAVFYSLNQPGVPIELDAADFEGALRKIKQGLLSTTVFMIEVDGKSIKTLVKDIQYNITNYKVIHIDFVELIEDMFVKVKVPIECVGTADCVGIKLGGFLRQVIRYVKVKCLPKDIPNQFELDIRDLKIRQSKRLSNISMPNGVKLLSTTDEVVVVIAKR